MFEVGICIYMKAVMIKYLTDETKNIYALKTATRGTKLHLEWLYNGFSMFIILHGDNTNAVNLCESDLQERFSELMTPALVAELLQTKNLVFKAERLEVSLYTHGEIKRDGGMQIKENPGVYAVYGVEVIDNDIMICQRKNAIAVGFVEVFDFLWSQSAV